LPVDSLVSGDEQRLNQLKNQHIQMKRPTQIFHYDIICNENFELVSSIWPQKNNILR